jgi:hypothetical protein
MNQPAGILDVAEEVFSVLADHRVGAVVIGAVAMAAHHYVRQTEDLELGVVATLKALRAVADDLTRRGYVVELREPGTDDPLAGVLDVRGEFGLIQLISYAGRFPAVIEDGLQQATLAVREGGPLRILPIPHLVALKLYAGGRQSKLDIMELLEHNLTSTAQRSTTFALATGWRGLTSFSAMMSSDFSEQRVLSLRFHHP